MQILYIVHVTDFICKGKIRLLITAIKNTAEALQKKKKIPLQYILLYII